MKREVRRIYWYTAEKEKTNDTKVIKVKRTAFFIIAAERASLKRASVAAA